MSCLSVLTSVFTAIISSLSLSIQTLQAVTRFIFHYPLLEQVDVALCVVSVAIVMTVSVGRPTTI
jgi:hypothetical protein